MLRNMSKQCVRFYSNQVEVPIDLIKQLRKETGAGLKDCRDALVESKNDINEAKKWLEKQHDNIVDKKRDRIAKEGGILATVQGNRALVFELNCETDFAGKEKNFLAAMRNIGGGLVSDLKNLNFENAFKTLTSTGKTVQDEVSQISYLLKEKVVLTRIEVFPKVPKNNARVFCHVHRLPEGDSGTPKIGKIVSLLEITIDKDNLDKNQEEELAKFGHSLAVQITGYSPKYLTKPEGVKVSNDDILTEQEYLEDNDITVKKAIEKFKQKTGITVTLSEMLRWTLAE